MANHTSIRTKQLYDPLRGDLTDDLGLDEIEQIVIGWLSL
jgi:hypothetical protein